ncbi:hypothetical protein RHGRI_004598 [Rhododendron griersonianum]|uniref:Uncharacterized protein n=1 Tax=Rhododendron griersonianum TaxID=479676 RepID=A0AAV6LA74_9ERIC|nr:hypothetical protein RHGRI_004598 [Rhododendron griersonianum]
MCGGEVMDEGSTRDDLLNSEITDTGKFSDNSMCMTQYLLYPLSTTWTNVKHNSYLASLEASFVKELHQSLGLLSSHSEYSDQFTVLQDGFSRRINSERSQPLPYNAAGSHFVKESSWMQRFRCSEVSDQNFMDEDQEEKSLSLSRPKRLKMDAADSSTNDQENT